MVEAGQWLWVDGRKAHRYGAVEEDPWEVLWVRMEGPRLNRLSGLLGVEGAAVWGARRLEEARAVYGRVFETMGEEGMSGGAALNAELARLLALVFEARQADGVEESVPLVLRKPVEQMRLHYFKALRVSDLAALAGMSPAHFSRLFRASFGTSPIDWLRRERINQAKRRLVEGDAQIQEVAEQVGYRDRFFFSKDFRRMVGMTPKEYREREQIGGLGKAERS
jgi:AraC-like DNA-binding protein